MSDFLAKNNICGQFLLKLVSRGNAIIAELLRLKDFIPKSYRFETKVEIQKYSDIVMDFTYFDIAETQESKIDGNEILRDLDEEFRDNYIEIITRFYLVFECIHTFIIDLNHFVKELEDGFYIHQSLDTIVADIEGKQLLCESLYLYGLMLLQVDVYIEGNIRERLLVSYYRYTPQRRDTQSNIDDVCKLFRDTGLKAKKPHNYPEDYFRRIAVDSTFIEMVIGRLRSDDIYGQLSIYSLSKHRSTALATQASMLYVCLYFSSNILHSETSVMREIVDKYFPDNWVISIYMGHTVHLPEVWESFKAAKLALNNTLEVINIKVYANSYGSNVPDLYKKTAGILKEGNLTQNVLLKEVNNIVKLLRECNVTIKWMMLHTLKSGINHKNKRSKQLIEMVIQESSYEPVQLFKLLLNTSQLELMIKDMLKDVLNQKEIQWNQLKTESVNSLKELSYVFSGSKPLTRIKKNENLEKWFVEISKQVESLDQDDNNSSRKIAQLIQALEEVQEFHQLEANMQIIQFLQEIRNCLHQMIQTNNLNEDNLIAMQIIGDLSYAWELIDSYTPIMQLGIKREPTLVIKLRAIFLKLASTLEIPLLRINQAQSEDLLSVSQYYSSELEIYVRKVLQIIPKMMFDKLMKIIHIQTSVLKELPTRLEKEKLKDYAQLDERFELAQLTHSISVFSQGMRAMKSTLVGVVCLDPKKLLEDGIRNELVQLISLTLNSTVVFNSKQRPGDWEQKISSVVKAMNGYKRSFEYIQDYININGLKIWQEEFTRIINYNVEQECNGFLRNKIHGWQSEYQSKFIPIPVFPSMDNVSVNFIGRLAREIIRITEPRASIYLNQTTTWYDIKTHKPIIDKQFIKSLALAIEICGLVGLDRLFSFMIITHLQKALGILQNKNAKQSNWKTIISNLQEEINPDEILEQPTKFYQNCINRTTKLWPELLEIVLSLGQLQLLRKLIVFHLNLSCKFNAKNLEASLNALSSALLLDFQEGKFSLEEKSMFKLSEYFDYSGLNDPFSKIYITASKNEAVATTLFVFTIFHISKLYHPGPQGNLNKRVSDQLDGYIFALGVHTVLKQFHTKTNDEFIKLMSKFITEFSIYTKSTKSAESSLEVINGLNFLQTFTNFSDASKKSFSSYISDEVLHLEQFVAFT